jgi:fission process protein 1
MRKEARNHKAKANDVEKLLNSCFLLSSLSADTSSSCVVSYLTILLLLPSLNVGLLQSRRLPYPSTNARETMQESGENASAATTKTGDYNVFRDSALRYLGYANEVGESFRYQFPRFVGPSYLVAFGYCTADALSAGWNVWSTAPPQAALMPRQVDSLRATVDTIVWQSTASVVVPGITINYIVKATRWIVRRPSISTVLPSLLFQWLPTATGLASVPVIIRPIDHLTDVLLDHTLRKLWTPSLPQQEEEIA